MPEISSLLDELASIHDSRAIAPELTAQRVADPVEPIEAGWLAAAAAAVVIMALILWAISSALATL